MLELLREHIRWARQRGVKGIPGALTPGEDAASWHGWSVGWRVLQEMGQGPPLLCLGQWVGVGLGWGDAWNGCFKQRTMWLDLHFRKLSFSNVADCLKVEENESRENTLGTLSNKQCVRKNGKEERNWEILGWWLMLWKNTTREWFRMIPRFQMWCGDGGQFTKKRYKNQETEQAWGGSKEKLKGGDDQGFHRCKKSYNLLPVRWTSVDIKAQGNCVA